MKKATLFLFVILIAGGFLRAQNCTTPISPALFQQAFNQVAIQPSNQKKLEKALPFAGSNCFSSAQVKNMAQLFSEDKSRIEFCKAAYVNTVDKENFFDVYDAFTSFSWALRLYDHVNKTTVTVPADPVKPSVQAPVFPNWAYPSFAGYNGKKGCAGPVVSEEKFNDLALNVFVQPTDEAKQLAIQNAVDQHCLALAHLMKLTSLIQSESLRLRSMTNSFARIYDQENYPSGVVVFTSTASQNEWTSFAKNYLTPPCFVTDKEFQSVLKDIQNQRFPQDKMNMISLLSKDRCFNVAQVKTISQEFSFGDDKLKVFRMMYAKCPDQNNYYKLVDELTFSSEKENLSNFIKNGGK